jgi:hypothetical protein
VNDRAELPRRPVRASEDAAALQGDDLRVISLFNPAFTYPIFGEHEKVFGYKGLDIQVGLPLPMILS